MGRLNQLRFGTLRALLANVAEIALTGICGVATVFLLTFLKALLQESRRLSSPRQRRKGKLIVLPSRDKHHRLVSRSA